MRQGNNCGDGEIFKKGKALNFYEVKFLKIPLMDCAFGVNEKTIFPLLNCLCTFVISWACLCVSGSGLSILFH